MGDFYEKNDNDAATENSSAAFSGWISKLRFDRSFTAKLILAEERIKEYYADIATEILKYEKIRSKTSWSGVTFSAGHERFASVAFVGKTLCLYLAIDPETLGDGKYKAKNVENVKKRAKTPSMLRIKSDGGKRYAIKLIDTAAENFGLIIRKQPVSPIDPFLFKTDSFNNLVTRGLIKILRYGHNPVSAETDVAESGARENGVVGEPAKNAERKAGGRALNAFDDTVLTTDELFSRHGVYNEITSALSEGVCKAGFSEKLMLRSIDEIWVRAIEDCVHSLDELIRNPNHFIAETEEVLPIELTKKVTGRSVAHLCRHTDYLSPGAKGDVTPTKMLNVFREDSIMTYENKFLNTLINRLYLFVGKRYAVYKERGADERVQTLEIDNSFPCGEGKARVKICVEYSERENDKTAKKALEGSGLWARTERLYNIVTGYVNSAFAKEMDKNFIHPPVMRTNAILKNKYFRECLALWEFIESYDDSGYGVVVEERMKEISPDFAKELYKNAAMLYFTFRRSADENYGEDNENEYNVIPEIGLPDDIIPERYKEEFEKENFSAEIADDVALSLLVALAADELSGEKMPAYRKSFAEKLCDSDYGIKNAFARICNELLAFNGVKVRYSRRHAAIRRGRQSLATVSFAGKSLKMHFALATEELPEKYRAKDASGVKRYSDTPSFIKVKSSRSLKYALEIVNLLAVKYALVLSPKAAAKINPEELSYEYFGLKSSAVYRNAAETEKGGSGYATENNPDESFPTEGNDLSFGTEKREIVGKAAAAVEKLAVKESGRLPEREGTPKPEKDDAAEKDADRIESIERVESNYAKPTDFGLDDSSGFMSDEKQTEKDNPHRRNGIFFKMKGKK